MYPLYIVSGPSGSGKTSIMRRTGLREVVSFTTRHPRPGEIEDVDYKFITNEEFMELKNSDFLIEHSQYGDNWYGLDSITLLESVKQGPSYSILDYDGMLSIKNFYEDCITIFMFAEKDTLMERMRLRGDSEERINQRISTYEDEMGNRYKYDYVVKNDDDKKTLDQIKMITGGYFK